MQPKINFPTSSIVLLTLLLLPYRAAGGISPEDWGAQQGDDLPLLDTLDEQRLDLLQEDASHRLIDFANWIDSFFQNEQAVSEENCTRANFKISAGYSRNDKVEIQPRFSWQLRLPSLSSRALLFFQVADEDDRTLTLADSDSDRVRNTQSEEGQLTAGVKFFLKESKKYNISVDTGANLDYLYGGLRFRSSQDLGNWQGRFTNRLLYFTDEGLENRIFYSLERQLSSNVLFRSTTGATLYEEDSNLGHSQQFRLFKILSSYQVLSFEAGIFYETKPSYNMEKTKFEVKYRQRFFRDWLVLEIAPKLSFLEEYDYRANPGLFFRLEASFGYKPEESGYHKIFH